MSYDNPKSAQPRRPFECHVCGATFYAREPQPRCWDCLRKKSSPPKGPSKGP